MGPQLEYLETVLTCKGNFYAPDFSLHLDNLKCCLQKLISSDNENKLVVKKVEPWNSVRVTLKMPVSAAQKLKMLAEQRDRMLHEIGILEVQIEGDKVISLTIDGSRSDVVDQTSVDSLKKNDTKGLLAPFSSGQCVPSNETLKSFNNLPQSFNLDWSVSSKTISSTDPAALSKPGIGSDECFYSAPSASSNIYNLISKTCNSSNIAFGACQALTPQAEQASCTQQTSKMWAGAEEKLVSSQNIASSSPLLVNLLKSPGSRAQLNSLTAAHQPHTPCELPTNPAVPALKRKRNQSRKCKRLKEEAGKSSTDCSYSNQSSDQSIPGTSSSFQYDSLGNCSLDGLTNASESRQIINPYTGVLEAIDDGEERTYVASTGRPICSKNMSAAVSCALECSVGVQAAPSCSRFNTNLNKTSSSSYITSFSDSSFLQPSSQPCLITSSSNFGASSFVTDSSVALHNSIGSSAPELVADKNSFTPNNFHISQHNHNSAPPHLSALSNPQKSHFSSNKPTTCYMQDMIQLLSAENKANLLSSQSLLIPTCPSRGYDAFKSMFDPGSLAKIMAQSSVLSGQNTLRTVNPSLFETRPVSLQPQVMFGLNGQMVHASSVGSRLPFLDPTAASANNMDVKLSRPSHFLSLEEFNKGISTTVNEAIFNGHPDSSCFHANVKHPKIDCSSETKSGLPYVSEHLAANGCRGSKPPVVDSVNTESTSGKSASSTSSSTLSVSPEASRPASSASEARSTQSSISKVPLKKPLKNQEEMLPQKSKANLTVAQLLEQVEIAKSHLASTNSNLQKDVPCDLTLGSHLTFFNQPHQATDAKSASFFPPKSVAAHKLSTSSYGILESLPMPITSPGYPHNLTESVQKAMQGVDFSSSPPPSPHFGLASQAISKQSGSSSLQNHSTSDFKFLSVEKDLARTLVSAHNLKEQVSNYNHLDVFENQFELNQLEEALKSSCRGQGLLSSGHEHIGSDGPKSLSDIDGSELDFVFNAEDERHLDSIIALKDYDDIEKLAETLASNIDDENIDEDMLLSENDVALMYAENSVFMNFKNDLLASSSLIDSSKSNKGCEQEVGSSQANPQTPNENKFDAESKSDENPGIRVLEIEVAKAEITSSDETCPITQSIDQSDQQAETNNSKECITRTECENSTSIALPPPDSHSSNAEDTGEAVVSCPNLNRMATRSSNKQKPHGNHSLSCATSNHHVESLQSNPLVVYPSSADNSKGPVECAPPTPRRSNRTIRKTELASGLLQAKTTEKSKRVTPRDDENTKETVRNNRARSTPKVQSVIPSRSVQNLKPIRHKTPQKRKYSKGTTSENSIIDDEGVKQQPSFDVEIETVDIASSPGCLDSSLSEADRTPCAKKQKTS